MGDPRALAGDERPAVRLLLKTLIPLFALLMALQGIAQAIRAIAVLDRALNAWRSLKRFAIAMVRRGLRALLVGYPVALTLGGVSLGFAVARRMLPA